MYGETKGIWMKGDLLGFDIGGLVSLVTVSE